MRKTVLFALAMVIAGGAVAQNAQRPDPKIASATVPPTAYTSAFEGYRPFVDQEVGDWRKANEEVGAAGAHLGHASQRAKPAAQPGASTPPAKAREEHGGHK